MTSATTTTDNVDIATLEASPVPNQMITIGASATIGIEPSATMKGCATRETNREYQRASPRTVPITLPSKNPSRVSSPVTPESLTRLPSLDIFTRKPHISHVEPNRNALSALFDLAYSHDASS